MSGFLTHIIGRHLGTVETVQPRLRSVFEPESPAVAAREAESSLPENTAIKDTSNAQAQIQATVPGFPAYGAPHPASHPAEPVTLTMPVPAEPAEGFKLAPQNQDSDREHWRHELQALRAQASQKSEPSDLFKNDFKPATSTPFDPAGLSAGESTAAVSPSGDVEGILKRISDQASRLAGVERRLQDQPQPTLSEKHASDSMPLKAGPESQRTQDPERGNKPDESLKRITSPDTTPDTPQSGILQTPPWLETLSADLSAKWSELNAQSTSEPVINVTIGRVEVRALNPEPAKAQTAETKPTGVMSLDDYLKRRESQGAK